MDLFWVEDLNSIAQFQIAQLSRIDCEASCSSPFDSRSMCQRVDEPAEEKLRGQGRRGSGMRAAEDRAFLTWLFCRLKHIHTAGLVALAAIAAAAALTSSEAADVRLFAFLAASLAVLCVLSHTMSAVWSWPWHLTPVAALVCFRLRWAMCSPVPDVVAVLDSMPHTNTFARGLLCIGGGLIALKPISKSFEIALCGGMLLSGILIGVIVWLRSADGRGFTFALNFACLPLCFWLLRTVIEATVQPLWRELHTHVRSAALRPWDGAVKQIPQLKRWLSGELPESRAPSTAGPSGAPQLGSESNAPSAAGPSGTPRQVSTRRQVSMRDFNVVGFLGAGGSSRVHLVSHLVERIGDVKPQLYALKSVSKRSAAKLHAGQAAEESRILRAARHPFVVSLHYAFEDERHIHLVLTYAAGGDLLSRLEAHGALPEATVRLCFAEIVCGIGHLHAHGILYRDLKPANVLIGPDGHVMLADFGVSKRLEQEPPRCPPPTDLRMPSEWLSTPTPLPRAPSMLPPVHAPRHEALVASAHATTATFVGTPIYMAPEVVRGHWYGYAADWWSAGVLLHELLTASDLLPHALSAHDLMDQLRHPTFEGFSVAAPNCEGISAAARQLIESLLVADAGDRLGSPQRSAAAASDAESVRGHVFFAGLDWGRLEAKQLEPPFPLHLDADSKELSNDTGRPSASAAAAPSTDASFEYRVYYDSCNDPAKGAQ